LALISAFDRRMQDAASPAIPSSPTKRQVSPIGFPCEWIIVSSLPFDARKRASSGRRRTVTKILRNSAMQNVIDETENPPTC